MSNLDYLVGKNVDIHKTGPGLFSGKILDVKSDYLVIKSKNDEIYYINLYHIHKIVEDDTRVSPPSDNTKEFFEANNFSSLLKNLTGQKICFNNGPEGFTGIIKEVDRDFLKCEEKGKTSCIFIFHIRCFKTSIPKQDSPKIIDEITPSNKQTYHEPENTDTVSKTNKGLVKVIGQLFNCSFSKLRKLLCNTLKL